MRLPELAISVFASGVVVAGLIVGVPGQPVSIGLVGVVWAVLSGILYWVSG